jgi:glycosyltransferase involved in cell wall biosynthesis
MTRILFVGQTGALGGAELVQLDIARHFRDRCQVALLADGPFRARLAAAGVKVSVLAAGAGMLQVSRQGGKLRALSAVPAAIATAWRLAGLARGCDVIYPYSQKAAVVAMLAGRLAGRPVVWHLHDILSAAHFGTLQRRVAVTLGNRLARHVIANSAATRDAFVACGGDPARITVVPNGIDAAPFTTPSAAEIAALRTGLGIAGVTTVGLFGRLAPWKGQHVLIAALPALPGVQALIVGDALFGEQDYRDSLKAQAAALGVADRVHWLGFRTDVPALMRAVDVVLHTSTAPEPFGRVLVEGMLARRPVIATRDGAATEVLGAQYAHLVRPGDPDDLAAAIRRVLAIAPAEAAAQAEAGFVRASRLFSAERMCAGIADVIDAATRAGRPMLAPELLDGSRA